MPKITISEEAYNFLAELAERENTTITQWIEDYVERLKLLQPGAIDTSDMPEAGTLAALAWAARKYSIIPDSDEDGNTPHWSREVLNEEYADHLLKRVREQNEAESTDSD
jgi:hypothetical protein